MLIGAVFERDVFDSDVLNVFFCNTLGTGRLSFLGY